MPDFVSCGGNWVQKEKAPPPKEPKVKKEVKEVKKPTIINIVKKTITNSKPKKGRK